MNANVKQTAATEIWLNYFNQYLFERNIITESERNHMTQLISQKHRATLLKIASRNH